MPIYTTGTVAGAMNISYGALTYQADNELPEEWRNSEFQDRSRPIITACEMGPLGALAGKLLKDMGFTNVSILEGGLERGGVFTAARASEAVGELGSATVLTLVSEA